MGRVTESPNCMGRVTESPNCMGRVTEFPNCMGGNTNCKHLECFVTLETHSQLHRGQMSHICDISPLRVKILDTDSNGGKLDINNIIPPNDPNSTPRTVRNCLI